MNRTLYSFVILVSGILFYLGCCSPVNATVQPDPIEQLRSYVEEIVSIFSDPNLHEKEKHPVRREKMIDKETVIAVSYVMMLTDDRWMVYDVIIEDVSLVQNYNEQFKQVLRREGYESLLKQVGKKVSGLEQRS